MRLKIFAFVYLLSASSFCMAQSNWVKITNNKTEDFHASFSPDGKRILFDSEQSGHNEVYLYDILTKETTQLTRDDSIRSDHPTWFPDSRHILFSYWKNGPGRYSMRVDGTERKLLIENAYAIASPKGDKVSFITNKNGDFDLYVIDSDGKNKRQLTNNKGDEVAMSWSSDEQAIAFMCEIEKRFQICKIGVDDSGYKQLTAGNTSCSEPHWSPKSDLLTYACKTDSNSVLCIVDGNGEKKIKWQNLKERLTTFPGRLMQKASCVR